LPDVEEMVSSLASRLQENPNDLAGWKMLGRSYFNLRNFPGAIAAFERAVELEEGGDGQTLTDLGEAILYSDGATIVGRAGDLFENALALSPNNPKALFYGGMAAIQRGDKELGANRWEALLATSPPPNVQDILRQQIAELRGEIPGPAPVATAPPPADAGVDVQISLGEEALAANLTDTTVFVIARDPAQPSPPIAAVRRRLSELPTVVSIGDADAMIPGRVPSGFARLEIIARVSLAGQPIAASGDWFGDAIIETADSNSVQITINQKVP
jgi:cytochrome c-type biogenesis protein CcmH